MSNTSSSINSIISDKEAIVNERENSFKSFYSNREKLGKLSNLNVITIRKWSNELISERNNMNIGEKRKFENLLLKLVSLQNFIKKKLAEKTGTGHISSSTLPTPSTNVASNNDTAIEWIEIASAFKSRMITAIILNIVYKDPNKFLTEAVELLEHKFEELLSRLHAFKFNLEFYCKFKKANIKDEEQEEHLSDKSFICENKEILKSYTKEHIQNILNGKKAQLLQDIEEFQSNGSGWMLDSVLHLQVNINKFTPLSAGSFIATPAKLKKRRGILNIVNQDEQCFVWSVLASLYKVDHNAECVSSYPQNFHEILNLKDLTMPVKLSEISKFERNNPTISIIVFGYDYKLQEICGPLYHTKEIKQNHIHLLYLTREDRAHYCLITNLVRIAKSSLHLNSHTPRFICSNQIATLPWGHYKILILQEDSMEVNECKDQF